MEKDLRVLYGVWPAAGAFATFALSNGVIQLYWLQDGGTRPTWLLGCWFALYNLVKLIFVGLAPRYGWTLGGQVVAAAGVGVGAAGVAGSFRCAWPLALTGAFCPIAAMPMRLNDEGLAPERFDAVVQHAWSCLVCGAICSALGAGAYELFGVGAVAGASFVACCVCCAAQAALLRRRDARPRARIPSPLSPGRKVLEGAGGAGGGVGVRSFDDGVRRDVDGEAYGVGRREPSRKIRWRHSFAASSITSPPYEK